MGIFEYNTLRIIGKEYSLYFYYFLPSYLLFIYIKLVVVIVVMCTVRIRVLIVLNN